MSKKSLILVIIQFSSFIFFALLGNMFASGFLLLLQFIGLTISLWGVLVMRLGNFNVQPEVKNIANLVISGPYKMIRNPMYSGLLLFFGIATFVNFTWLRLLIFIVLSLSLILKIIMEEDFLTEKFGKEYRVYKKKTYRLIPFLF